MEGLRHVHHLVEKHHDGVHESVRENTDDIALPALAMARPSNAVELPDGDADRRGEAAVLLDELQQPAQQGAHLVPHLALHADPLEAVLQADGLGAPAGLHLRVVHPETVVLEAERRLCAQGRPQSSERVRLQLSHARDSERFQSVGHAAADAWQRSHVLQRVEEVSNRRARKQGGLFVGFVNTAHELGQQLVVGDSRATRELQVPPNRLPHLARHPGSLRQPLPTPAVARAVVVVVHVLFR